MSQPGAVGLDALPDLVERVLPSVVEVRYEGGNGSGFLVPTRSPDGKPVVITNRHVIEDTDGITLFLHDGSQVEADVVGAHPLIDIAVLRPSELGDARRGTLDLRERGDLRLGEFVLAIGSPLGHRSSVGSGIVSGLDRVRQGPDDIPSTMIQTDAAVIHGNSGGPLVGLDGRVVGVNSQIERNSRGVSSRISFAIPGHAAALALDAILAFKADAFPRPYAGIPIDRKPWVPSTEVFRKLRVSAGVRVKSNPQPSTPAAAAGLEADDVIIAIDDTVVDDPGDIFLWLLDHHCVGRSYSFTYLRNGVRKSTKIEPVLFESEER